MMDYTFLYCDDCGGTIGVFDRRTFSCQDCGKQFDLRSTDYDRLLMNEVTGWVFPVLDESVK